MELARKPFGQMRWEELWDASLRIHGAIIAREYGLPCVTGIPEVTRLLKTGDQVTVDGHLGMVTRHPADPPRSSTDR